MTCLDLSSYRDLRAYAAETKRPISSILDEAVAAYLDRERVCPAFMVTAAEVIEENTELT